MKYFLIYKEVLHYICISLSSQIVFVYLFRNIKICCLDYYDPINFKT